MGQGCCICSWCALSVGCACQRASAFCESTEGALARNEILFPTGDLRKRKITPPPGTQTLGCAAFSVPLPHALSSSTASVITSVPLLHRISVPIPRIPPHNSGSSTTNKTGEGRSIRYRGGGIGFVCWSQALQRLAVCDGVQPAATFGETASRANTEKGAQVWLSVPASHRTLNLWPRYSTLSRRRSAPTIGAVSVLRVSSLD